MEINDFKPKDPTATPGVEGATAVKENVVEEVPVEDETITPVAPPPLGGGGATDEDEPVLTVEGKTITPTELVESLTELKDRAKAAGLRPVQNMVTSYISQGLAMVDGLLESLEGSKKKKDK